jgi:Ca2+/Na+ antiporter
VFTVFIRLIFPGSVSRPTVMLTIIFVVTSDILITDTKLKAAYAASVFCAFYVVFLYSYRLKRKRNKTKPGKSGRNFGERILYVL